MTNPGKEPRRSTSRRFFVRGLAIVLPTVLTIWILIAAYGFVQQKIAQPINAGVRELVLRLSPWPKVLEEKVQNHLEEVIKPDPERSEAYESAGDDAAKQRWLRLDTRRKVLNGWWKPYEVALDLIGLLLAVVLIYMTGAILGSFIGHRLYARGEALMRRIPLFKQIYPSVKQVTDFLVGDGEREKFQFSKVVAVEYPRKGLWSVGLLTGDTMKDIHNRIGKECVTVFVPSSPTPFTGYVITAPREDTIELPISLEEALRFTISGGVILPESQQMVLPVQDQVDESGQAS